MSNTYSPEFKLKVVLRRNFCVRRFSPIEPTRRLLAPTKYIPSRFRTGKKKLKEDGPKAFGGAGELKEKEKKIAKLER
jgi:hypothetical protein